MEEIIYDVYVKLDERNCIIRVESTGFHSAESLVEEGLIKVDSGTRSDMYHHAQPNYLRLKYGKPTYSDDFTPNFKYEDGEIKEITEEEKEEWFIKPRMLVPMKDNQQRKMKAMMEEEAQASFLVALPDAKAATIPYCYPSWQSYIGGKLKKDVRVEYDGALWKTRQEIQTVLKNQFPSIDTAALYERIDVEHAGTLEDPIPYANTMEVFKDKYYLEDGIIYLCLEDSGQPLYASCKDLPRYFVVSPRMA